MNEHVWRTSTIFFFSAETLVVLLCPILRSVNLLIIYFLYSFNFLCMYFFIFCWTTDDLDLINHVFFLQKT